MESTLEKMNIDPENFSFYLDLVGGRHLFLKIGNGKLLKLTSESEVKFYELYSKCEFSFLPKFFFSFDRNQYPEMNNAIIELKNQLDLLIYDILQDYDEEKLKNLCKMNPRFFPFFNTFITTCQEKLHLKNFSEEIKSMHKKISEFSEEKMKFFLNYYIFGLNRNFDHQKFVIIEDLTYGMNKPSIIDIKLGNLNANMNFDSNNKLPESMKELGIRVSGAQFYKNDQMIFINRYDGREFDLQRIYELLKDFFHLSDSAISKVESIKEEYIKYKIKGSMNSSLIIIYDHKYVENSSEGLQGEQNLVNVKLIDFNYFDRENELKVQYKDNEEMLRELEIENYTYPIENILKLFGKMKCDKKI